MMASLRVLAPQYAARQNSMHDYATNAAFREKMKGYTDLYITGSREILQVA